MSEWISVDKGLPDWLDLVDVFVVESGHGLRVPDAVLAPNDVWYWRRSGERLRIRGVVTHWRRKPAPPQEQP